MLFLAAVLAMLGLLLLWQAHKKRDAAGLPGGQVIYADTGGWQPVKEPLYYRELGLTGKPDYLVKQGEQFIPVEVKSSRVDEGPYDNHIYQLAAYCILVEHQFGKRPVYGILHYPNRTYRIDFSPALESDTLLLLEEMRQNERRKELDRSHAIAARCHACGFRSVCDQRMF
jgi:CRISPR-associated exonuclease Cas4